MRSQSLLYRPSPTGFEKFGHNLVTTLGLSRRSVTTIFLKIRGRISEECERASPFSSCEVEVDESYFGYEPFIIPSSKVISGQRSSVLTFADARA